MADLNSSLVRGNLRVTDDAQVGGNVQASKFNNYPISGSVGANTIPIRDNNGYVYFNYINTNVGVETSASSSSYFLYANSDGWIRKASASTIKSALSIPTSYVSTVNSKTGAVTVSGSFSGTKTNALVTGVSVNSQGSVTLTANDATATGRITYVQSISGSAPSLGGTTTFVTGYGSFSGGSGSLTSNDTSSGGIAYIASHTNASLGTPSTGTVGISGASYTPAGSVTVTSTRTTSGSGDTARRVLTITSSFSGTAATITPSLTGTKTFVTGYPNFSGGGSTTKYLHHSHTGASLGTASTGTVSISGGSYSATTKYLSASHSGTTLTVSKGDYTPAGSVTISATN